MAHSILSKVVGARRALITLITAILGVLVAFGVPLNAHQENIILGVIGLIFSYLAGDAYVQGKHIEAVGRIDQGKATAQAIGAAAAADPQQTVVPSTGA